MSRGVRPIFSVEKVDDSTDPETAEFRYVVGYTRKYLGGLFGPAVGEVMKTTTIPELRKQRVQDEWNATAGIVAVGFGGVIPELSRHADRMIVDMERMIENTEPRLVCPSVSFLYDCP